MITAKLQLYWPGPIARYKEFLLLELAMLDKEVAILDSKLNG